MNPFKAAKLKDLGQQLDAVADAWISHETKETWILRSFTLLKLPLIAFLGPRVDRMDEERVEITIPLSYRSKNHLGSMYFGALATGADLALGFLVMREIQKREKKIELIFASFQAEFLKRAKADVKFVFDQGAALQEMLDEVTESAERVTREFDVVALTPSVSGDEPVARFKLGLSLKNRG